MYIKYTTAYMPHIIHIYVYTHTYTPYGDAYSEVWDLFILKNFFLKYNGKGEYRKMPYTCIKLYIKSVSLSHIFSHGIFLNRPDRQISLYSSYK